MHRNHAGSDLAPYSGDGGRGLALPPGHAWFALDIDEDDHALLLACSKREQLESLLEHVNLNLRARAITVIIDNVAVPVVVVLLRIQGSHESALFSAWVNALSYRTSGILDKLATQPHLPVVLVDEHGHTVGASLVKNVLLPRINSLRNWIEDLARANPWTSSHFAAAKTYIRSQHPTNEDLWELFNQDSGGKARHREFTAVPA